MNHDSETVHDNSNKNNGSDWYVEIWGGNIGDRAFENCTTLESVTLPKDLKVIPESMFRQCKRLQSITIPDGLREIEDYAFDGCESLRDIVISDSVIEIGSYAFDRHSGITLRGKKGSEAERYAKENDIALLEIPL